MPSESTHFCDNAVKRFIDTLARSNLLPRDQIDSALTGYWEANTSIGHSVETLCQFLVNIGSITAWQASMLQAGKYNGFLI